MFNEIHLFRDDLKERAKRIALVCIAQSVDDRQQFVQSVFNVIHRGTSFKIKVSGTSGVR